MPSLFDPNFEIPPATSLIADLQYIEQTIGYPQSDPLAVEKIILGLTVLLRTSVQGWDTASVSTEYVDSIRDLFSRIRYPDYSDFPKDFKVLAMAAAKGLLIPHSQNDTLRPERNNVVRQFVAKLTDLYYHQKIMSDGNPLFLENPIASAIYADETVIDQARVG